MTVRTGDGVMVDDKTDRTDSVAGVTIVIRGMHLSC